MSHDAVLLPVGGGSAGFSGADLFRKLWAALADLLGTAATAALVTRAARRAVPRHQELRELAIERIDGEFHYVVPASFGRGGSPPEALRALAGELRPLLAESTGEVALRHLAQLPELRDWAAADCVAAENAAGGAAGPPSA